MSIDLIRRIGLLIMFALVQVLILNHIHLLNVATPLVYVYFVLMFPRDHKRWMTIILSFLLGVTLDSFSNTPGESAFTLTLIAFLQPYILELYLGRDDSDNYAPSMANMGFSKYSTYVLLLTFVYCIVFFSIEAFSLFNWLQWLLCIIGSWLLTSLIIIVVDSVRR